MRRPGIIDEIATWNIEGASLEDLTKLTEVIRIMRQRKIGVMALQETHICGSPLLYIDGYFIILSGGTGDGREYAGVGFIVAPSLRQSIASFTQHSARIASLTMRVEGGTLAIISAYAPQSKRPYEERKHFHHELQDVYRSRRAHGMSMVLGDLNARIHNTTPDEAGVLGPFVFGNPAKVHSPTGNRELMIETCRTFGLVAANTRKQQPPERLVTYFDLAANPASALNYKNFAQLDYVLVPSEWENAVHQTYSDRTAALASHHFLLRISLDAKVEKTRRAQKTERPDVASLRDKPVAALFAKRFAEKGRALLPTRPDSDAGSPQVLSEVVQEAFGAAAATLPSYRSVPAKPWISSRTLALLDERDAARLARQWTREKELTKWIKGSARRDRSSWLDAQLENGDWKPIRRLKTNTRPPPGRMRNAAGVLVESNLRAETMAEYYETVQWRKMLATALPDGPMLGPILPVSERAVDEDEVLKTIRRLKSGKAAGRDGIPPEYWHALAGNIEAVQIITLFCQSCWRHKEVPAHWRDARVVAIFKKGDDSLPENYRPISLLSVGYKVFSAILLDRLKKGGAEQRIRATQFGFRTGVGTSDALFVARRLIDKAWAEADGSLLMLLLDWTKAFDRIDANAMRTALIRFGLPPNFVSMVGSIYNGRRFVVADGGHESSIHEQASGIAQGCPLSPFLFTIVM